MEITSTIRISIEDKSQCSEARRAAMELAREIGFDEVRAGRVAIVVTEACTNILKHATRGEILLQVTDPDSDAAVPELELLALDKGPGMPDIEECLRDGYTTGCSPGLGLGAIRRLSDESDFYSVPGEGTAILARWPVANAATRISAALQLRVGAVNVSKHGEEFCGDSWGMEQTDETFTVLVADGLGHGYEASQASLEAVRILRDNRELPPGTLIDLAHRALRSSRGAAVSVARIDHVRGKIVFSGLGNVTGQIYGGSGHNQHLVSVSGTAGHQSARIREFSYPWPADSILVMHSDGLATGTSLESRPALALRDPSLIAGVLYRDYSRGHDDATVIVAKAA
ncbi:MAG TPA: ATP-binding SpoIIE family protein phosphatase [Bryobacteraceae bacterium]